GTTALTAGNHTVTAAYSSDSADFENSTSPPLTQAVSRAALTVRADDKTAVYGSAIPTLTGSITALQTGDAITASYSTVATTGSPAGTYDITPGLSDPDHRLGNYDISVVHGTLVIHQATPSLTWDTPADIVYGTGLGTTQLAASANV